MTKLVYNEFRPIEPFEDRLSIAQHPRTTRLYLNEALDKLSDHMMSPDRPGNVALGTFCQHIAPNTGTAGLLQWMLTHSGLIENMPSVGITSFTDARLTDFGAELLVAGYREAKRMPLGPVDEALAIEREITEVRLDRVRAENEALQQEVERLNGIIDAAGGAALALDSVARGE